MNRESEKYMMRRVAGAHDIRLDGVIDILSRARGASVFDVGCNRGLVAQEFFRNGAVICHGCDIDPEAILVAKGVFADLRACESKFEVVDLTEGPKALNRFDSYDIVVLLATYHKIKRVMDKSSLSALMVDLGKRTLKWFVWRGTSEKANENEGEILQIDRDMKAAGLKRIHTSYISQQLGVACIWERQ